MAGRSQTRQQNEQCRENALLNLMKIIKRFYPELFAQFRKCTTDPRHPGYITYTVGTILTVLFFKYALSIVSMREMTRLFNYNVAVTNILKISNQPGLMDIPHYQTINEFLARFSPAFMEELRCGIITHLIRTNQFYGYRLNKCWLIAVDGTQIYGGAHKVNSKCLFRIHKKGEPDQHITYHIQVLEAKLILFGTNIGFSFMTEFIENTPETEDGPAISDEKYKQDCELKAFKRLAERIHQRFPRMPICIVADALYNRESAIKICEDYGWKYIFRFKDGTIKSIAEEVQALGSEMEKGKINPMDTVEDVEYLKELDYKGHKVHYLRAKDHLVESTSEETRGRKKKETEKEINTFQWLTNIDLSPRLAVLVALAGRSRWIIENEGFNRQKNWSGQITHLCSWNEQAIKNHYLMMQIADMFRQLFEFMSYTDAHIRRTFGQVRDDLLFQLTTEVLTANSRVWKTILEKLLIQ